MQHIFQKTHNKLITIQVGYDAGARSEGTKYSLGLAHMLEHMMFKGTKTRTNLEISKEMGFLGGDFNAFTDYDLVCYHIRVPFENFIPGLNILSDMLLNSTFPEDEFLKEREVVLEEFNLDKDNPTHELTESYYSSFFSGRLKTSVIGTEESIKGFTRDEVIKFYKEFYDDGIVIVSGNLDEATVYAELEKAFGPNKPFVRKNHKSEITYSPSAHTHIHKPNLEQSYIWVAYPGLSVSQSDDKLTSSLMTNILGDGADSRLFTEVREKNNLCYGINLDGISYLDSGSYIISSSTKNEQIEKMLEIVEIEVNKIKTELVTEEELQRSKNKLRAGIYGLYDSGHSLAREKLVRAFYGLPSLEELSAQIDLVTREDIMELANKAFKSDYKMSFVLNSHEME